jgi:hypothetical protein
MGRARRLLAIIAFVGAATSVLAQAPARVVVFEEFGNPG